MSSLIKKKVITTLHLWKIYCTFDFTNVITIFKHGYKGGNNIVSISIILLSVYGADVAVLHLSDDKVGFLPFDHMIRGIGLGMPALILPFISFMPLLANIDYSCTVSKFQYLDIFAKMRIQIFMSDSSEIPTSILLANLPS